MNLKARDEERSCSMRMAKRTHGIWIARPVFPRFRRARLLKRSVRASESFPYDVCSLSYGFEPCYRIPPPAPTRWRRQSVPIRRRSSIMHRERIRPPPGAHLRAEVRDVLSACAGSRSSIRRPRLFTCSHSPNSDPWVIRVPCARCETRSLSRRLRGQRAACRHSAGITKTSS